MTLEHSRKSYQQWCPVASALDQVGDRWTLLLVRNLLVQDRRFGELRDDLVGISPTLLSTRLRGLIEEGLVVQREGRYSLTARGRELEGVVAAIGQWGLADLGTPTRPEHTPADYRVTGLTSLVRPNRIPAAPLAASIRLDGEPLILRVVTDDDRPRVYVELGEPADCVVAVRASMTGLTALHLGTMTVEELELSGELRLDGDEQSKKDFLNLISLEHR